MEAAGPLGCQRGSATRQRIEHPAVSARHSDSGQCDAHVSWVLPPDTGAVAHLAVAVGRSHTADIGKGEGSGTFGSRTGTDAASSTECCAEVVHHCDDYLADAPWCNEDDYASTQAPDSDDDRDLDEDSDVWDPGGESAFDSPSYYGC